jgi:hypothetical protein
MLLLVAFAVSQVTQTITATFPGVTFGNSGVNRLEITNNLGPTQFVLGTIPSIDAQFQASDASALNVLVQRQPAFQTNMNVLLFTVDGSDTLITTYTLHEPHKLYSSHLR